jgi:RNA recognition motif-containing protein
MTFYVSNLAPDTTRTELLEAFRAHGEVASVTLPGERMKGGRAQGAHRGYGFVVMRHKDEARAALQAIEGKSFHGLALSVQTARPRWTPTYVS